MRCTSPRTVGFLADGKTISWSQKNFSKQYATFQLPCGKCISCRLEYARSWAVRCVHEAKMYENNCFITLTYNDEHLGENKLDPRDFDLFVMKLRSHIRAKIRKTVGKVKWSQLDQQQKKEIYDAFKIGIFATGEYGEKSKRKHWHALVFNWRPSDSKYKYSNDRGDRIFSSETLDALWGMGITELGSVTFESAGYCARYSAKKLVHGKDDEHDYQPISRKSTHTAIGKKFLEKYYSDIFDHGYIVLPNGEKTSIPRYYEKWFQKHHPKKWEHYVTQTKQNKVTKASEKSRTRLHEYQKVFSERLLRNRFASAPTTSDQARTKIQQSKFKQLQSKLKL